MKRFLGARPVTAAPVALLLAAALTACEREEKLAATIPFEDTFGRAALGEEWVNYGGQWDIRNGWLHSPIANNSPLWLRARLPRDFRVEFDAKSLSPAVDTKFEVAGDGRNHASGYVLILGGWNNTISAIARLDEHGKDRKAIPDSSHKPNTVYHWKVERKGNKLSWFIDGAPYMEYDDPEPLAGPGHDRFAFNNWQSDVYYDNLRITPLP